MTYFKLKDFFNLLDLNEKKNLGLLIFLLTASVFFEAIGIGLILPLISILIEPEIVVNFFSQFTFIPKYLLTSHEVFLQTIVIFITVVFTLKAVILTIFTRVYIKFGYSLQYNLTKQLYWKYLKSTYDFHINTNTSTLIANINIEVTNLIKGYFFSAIQLFTEVFVIIGIMIVLLFLQFKLTLVIKKGGENG